MDNYYHFTLFAGGTVANSTQALSDLKTDGLPMQVVLQAYSKDAKDGFTVPAGSVTLTLNRSAQAANPVGVKSLTSTFTAPLTAHIGDAVSSYATYNGILSDLKIVSDKGASLNIKNTVKDLPEVTTEGDANKDVIDSNTHKFAKAGTAVQTFVVAPVAADLTVLDDSFNLANSTVNGVAFRKVGGNYYALGKDFEVATTSDDGFIKEGKTLTVTRNIKVSEAETVPTEEKVSGVVQINYVPGYGIQVWDSYKDGKIVRDANGKAKKLAHGTAWKVFKKITIKGTTYYNLGGNQWVSDDYAKFSEK